MIPVDYRLIGGALLKPLQSGIRSVLRVLEWLLRASPPAPAPQETTQVAARPAEAPPPPAGTEDPLAEAVAHLEYLGYHVEFRPDDWSYATHPYRYNFHLRTFTHGIHLHCMVGIGASIDNSRASWLEFLNTTNDRSHLTRFSLVDDKDTLYHVRMRARVSGAYSRPVFAMAMDMWHDDLELVRRRPEFPLERQADEHEDAAAVTVN